MTQDKPLHGNTKCDDCNKTKRDAGRIRRDPYRGGVCCDRCYVERGQTKA